MTTMYRAVFDTMSMLLATKNPAFPCEVHLLGEAAAPR